MWPRGPRVTDTGNICVYVCVYVYAYVYVYACVCVCVCVCVLCTGTGNEQVGRAAAPSCNEEAHSPSLPQASPTAIYLVS